MTKLAAIEGQLVSIKNVSTHKSACLTIHVPEEYALKVIEAFGWPTMVAPVPVALARINQDAKPIPETKPDKAKRKWDELSVAQKAGIMCQEKGFQTFIAESMAPSREHGNVEVTAEDAATWIRQRCGVNSRAHIEDKPEALRIFRDLDASYRAWLVAS